MSKIGKLAAILAVSAVTIVSVLASAGAANASEIGTVWNTATVPVGTAGLDAVAFGDGVFIGVTNVGGIYRSTDGKSWTEIANDGTSWTAVTYGEGTFAVIGHNEATYSTDGGLTFSAVTSMNVGSSDIFYALAYGNGLFVATEGDNCNNPIATAVSEDGQTWQSGADLNWDYCQYGAVYGDGKFVTVGTNDDIEFSTDPTAATGSWTSASFTGHTPDSSNVFSQVAFNGTEFLTIGTEFDGVNFIPTVYTSSDGESWASAGTSGLGNSDFWGLGWDGVGWLAGADTNGSGIYHSVDGVNWVKSESTETQWWSFALGDGIVVAGGQAQLGAGSTGVDLAVAIAWSAGPDPLPDTGSSTDTFAVATMIATLMMGLGVAAVYATRRRNS